MSTSPEVVTDSDAANPFLEIKDLAVAFRGTPAVNGVSFHINKGETLALVGESGSGKSVTALSVLQLLPYPVASHPTGSVLVDGEEVMGAPEGALRGIRGSKVSMIFQEPMTSLNPLHRIEKQIAEVLLIHRGIKIKQCRDRVLELLQLVGLQDPEQKMQSYPHELSGGQRQRVMIAMALANEPDLLIADEPTTALDVTIQAQILELLKDLQSRLGMAMLLITHDLGVVRKMADRVCVMTQGDIVETGICHEVFDNPQHDYTKHLIAAEPKGEPIPEAESETVIELKDLTVKYPLGKGFMFNTRYLTAVDQVSLSVGRGQTLGIVGESGSGKTTLGMALLRLIRSEGDILLEGTNIQGLKASQMRQYRRDVQIVFQDPFGSLSPRLSIHQIVEEGLLVHEPQMSVEERREAVADILTEVGLDASALDRYPHEFSGGQRQRIAVARALILKPKLVVLDEPTSALDMSVQAQIVDMLRDLQRRFQLTYLFISHDLKVVRALSNHVIVMKDGVVVETGTGDQIFENPQTDYTRALIAAAFDLEVA
ncbi:MAG: microcin ABC transporter ATP-binding protein [OM182 bacterium MED-G24]|mgnify:FL=1|uniref:Microcin ABC transporter ATP-binding protein n=1 Tax=OM182 bacterium MED-G24 TaxID=1986255 RepID=A0A2A5WM87_9GAMM|nr:MAG: microcin ABC transporter ATP-binding protein [OM182 bacterium MED-G24]|tara:strand:+ start:2430 stop:4055 length:1626 start_codon:yes stop_codon:yes gene_type:complete